MNRHCHDYHRYPILWHKITDKKVVYSLKPATDQDNDKLVIKVGGGK